MKLCAVAAVLTFAAACGGSEKPAVEQPESEPEQQVEAPEPEPEDEEDEDEAGEMEVEGLAGRIDPYDIERAISPHAAALADCYHSRVKKDRYIDGEVEIKFKVGRDGRVKTAHLMRSSLGAWQIERGLLDIARAVEFTKPRGRGDADFSVPLDFTSGRSKAVWWSEEQAEAEVDDYRAELAECGRAGKVLVTLYLGPRGVVKSAGFAADKPFSDEWGDCAEQKILAWKLSDPRGRVAKLGFWYNAR